MASESGHAGPSSGRSHALLAGVAHWLMDNSVILYVAAIAGHRAWVLLNSDVGELLRRHSH